MIAPIRDRQPDAARPRVSVVLPVLDGAATLGPLLDTLAAQRIDGAVELLAVDSGSRDGSLELLLASPARVFAVPRRLFGHGRTRNAAISQARAAVVVMLSQDALPAGPDLLQGLCEPLEADPSLAGCYARQVAPPGTDPLVAAALERWTPPGPDHRQRALTADQLARLSPIERVARCRFDDVASSIRRSVWRHHPLPDVPFGEDIAWARRVLTSGHDLLYRGGTEVLHAHEGGILSAFRRDRAAHERLAAEFGLRTIPSALAGLAGWIAGWRSDWRDLREARVGGTSLLYGLSRGATRRAGAVAGQYVGGRVSHGTV